MANTQFRANSISSKNRPSWMSDEQYRNIAGMLLPGSGYSESEVLEAFTNAAKSHYMDTYGLSEDQWSLVKPLMASGKYGQGEIARYISDLLAAQQDREYNSPIADVARQRAAGLNPDLLGVGETPAAASPAAPEAMTAPLPSQGGKGTLHGRFAEISSQVLQLAAFGVNAYGTIANVAMRQGLQLAGFAQEDVLSVVGDEQGMVTDVTSLIEQGIRARGLHGNKAKRYAAEVTARVNAMPNALKRLNQAADYQEAQSRLKLSTFKNSDEYVNSAIDSLRLQQQTDNALKRIDLLEAEAKEKFLLTHPNYTADSLDAALRGEIAKANEQESKANIAKTQEGTAQLQKQIAQETLEQEKTQTKSAKETEELESLRRTLVKLELEGIDKMLDYVKAYEEGETYYGERGLGWEFRHHQWNSPGMDSKHTSYKGEHFSRTRYEDYKARIAEYYKNHPQHSKQEVSFNVGPFGFKGDLQ